SDARDRLVRLEPAHTEHVEVLVELELHLAHGDPSRYMLTRRQRLGMNRMTVPISGAEVRQIEMIDFVIANETFETKEILTPIEIAVDGDTFRMRARRFVEPREVIGMRERRLDEEPDEQRDRERSPDLCHRVRGGDREQRIDRQDVTKSDIDAAEHRWQQHQQRRD